MAILIKIFRVILLLGLINFEAILTAEIPGIINLLVQLVFVVIYFNYFYPSIVKQSNLEKSTLIKTIELLLLMCAFNLDHLIASQMPSVVYLTVCLVFSVILSFWLLPYLRAWEKAAG